MKKRGYGIGSMWYGIGSTAATNPSGAFVDFLDDGTAIVMSGCADIGQGSTTVLAQIAAETLGVGLEDVVVITADTGMTPDSGPSSASRQTYISGNAVRLAAEKAREQVIAKAAEMLDLDPGEIRLRDGQVWYEEEPAGKTMIEVIAQCRGEGILTLGHGTFNPATTKLDPATGQGVPYATYAFATQIAEVEVDTETGIVEVKKIVAAHDVGAAVNPQNVEGQIEGGCSMGVGYALLEEVVVDGGEIKNPGLSSYLIPTALDMPEVFPMIVEAQEPSGPYGAKGVGEPALVPTAAAIANAVADALGIRLYDLPLTPERIVAAIKAAASSQHE